MDKWEYKFIRMNKWHPDLALAALNEAGQQGWELVIHHWGRFTFKRRIIG